jgi:GNAT superfamily N-acetyltransferase
VSDVVVRPMQTDDLEAVSALAGKLLRLHVGFDALRYLNPTEPEKGYARFFGSELQKAEVSLRVAVRGESIVGYTYARAEPRDWNALRDACVWLHDIYVDEGARGAGVATALLGDLRAWSKAQGAPRVMLQTAVQNTAAQRLFAREGFRSTMLEMTMEL